MPEDRNALLAHYRATREALLAAIDGLSDEQMSEHTLDRWSVNDHLAHIARWDEIRASEVVRISAGYDSIWRLRRPQVIAMGEIDYAARAGITAAQARWELDTTRERLLGAIANASERGLDGSLYGEAGLRSTHEVEHTDWINRWRREQRIDAADAL